MARAFDKQIDNRNFLSPVGFKFTLAKDPKVSFFSNSARIPEISLGTAIQSNYLKDIDIPGDRLTYGDFSLRFLVDENLENYMSIHNWLTGLGFPESAQDFTELLVQDDLRDSKNTFSDGSLHILNSNYRDVAIVKFRDLFPTFLTSLDFESSDTDISYFTAEATFKYTIYDIVAPDNRTPL
jgi:RNA recognition motif-containing protein